MKSVRFLLSALFLTATLGLITSPAWADGVLLKVRAGQSNYCHLKFPAIQEHTFNWSTPVLKNASSGDIIDFYGPCDYNPAGKAAVHAQRLQWQRRLSRDYNN